MSNRIPPPVFFEMLQSFVALAKNLNLSQAVNELRTTRQTIRRHINNLEKLREEKFFVLKDRKYGLTLAGQQAFAEALILLDRAHDWFLDRTNFINGLASASVLLENGFPFFAQRHPIMKLWSMAPPLLQKGLQAWTSAQCQIEHNKLKKIRPYLIIYRRHGLDWICAEVGEKSSYATWLGWSWAKSAVGSNFYNDPISSKTDRFIIEAYETVARTGSVWYDHICTKIPRTENGELSAVNYQRLVFACLFPNGEPAVASLVARTNNIQIEGLDPKLISKMQKADLMEFDL